MSKRTGVRFKMQPSHLSKTFRAFREPGGVPYQKATVIPARTSTRPRDSRDFAFRKPDVFRDHPKRSVLSLKARIPPKGPESTLTHTASQLLLHM